MKHAIIAYDLKNVTGDQNSRVKDALLRYSKTRSEHTGQNILTPFPDWITLKFPDTTILVEDVSVSSPTALINAVKEVIESEGATPDKVFAAFIDGEFQIWNSEPARIINPLLRI